MKTGRLIKKREERPVKPHAQHLNGADDRLRQSIAEAAYALYEQRGRQDGHDLEDWFRAEALVTSSPTAMV